MKPKGMIHTKNFAKVFDSDGKTQMEGKKNLRKNIFLVGTLLLSMFMISFVSADVTLVSPAASSYNNGATVAWNVTNSSGFNHPTSCQIWASSASTANSTAVNISQYANASATAIFIAGNFSSQILEDASDYSFFASCTNLTGTQQNTSASTIIIDNSAPTAASSLSPASGSVDTDGSVTISGTVIGENTTACTLYFVNGPNYGGNQAMTHTSDSCSITLTNVPEQSYNYIIETSDGYNKTNTSSTTFNVDVQTGNLPNPEQVEQMNDEGGTNPLIWLFIVVVIIIAWLLKRK